MKVLFALLFSISMWAQDCSPYHRVKNWEVNEDVKYTLSLVSCFHAYGISPTLDWNNYSVGFHIMGQGHDGAAYLFSSYQYRVKDKFKISAGPLYRLNNESGFLLGQFGGDVKLYKSIWLTSRILQINPSLNYLNVGVKISI